jgi:neutral ceramidase
MRLPVLAILAIACVAFSTARGARPIAASGVKAGFAERDITPGIGMEQPGGYRKVLHKSFHDPCKVRVAVFDDGRRKVALIGTDTLIIPRQVVLNARKQIEQACGIPGDAVMIGASHSHSSGPVGMVQPGEYDGASAEIRRLAYEESSMADPGFLLRVTHEIVEGVKAANASLTPAQMGFGYGHEDKVGFNRRLRMKNGQSWSHPGAMNPDIVEYAGPIDPQVGVIGVWDAAGELLGVVVNFSCHATTNPGGISANWPYFMERTIQGAMETRAPIVFLQGACGDVTQVDNLSPYGRQAGVESARFVGGRVGAEAVKVLLGMAKGTDIPLDARQRVWKVQRRAPAAERVAAARRLVAAGPPAGDNTEYLFAKEILMVDYLLTSQPEVEVEVQAIAIGPAVCVSNPAEYFVQFGLDIKKGSPFQFTFPVELANGCVGYVPTEEAFSARGGGYETRLTSYSNLEITAGRQFADTGIALARQMSPGKAPERPRLPAPGTPWPYGSVAPQVR